MPGDGELGPLFAHKVERQFFTSPNRERNQGRSISGRAHPGYRVIQGRVYRSCKKINSILNCGDPGKGGGTWPLISSSVAELGAPSPHAPAPPSPEVENRRSKGRGVGARQRHHPPAATAEQPKSSSSRAQLPMAGRSREDPGRAGEGGGRALLAVG